VPLFDGTLGPATIENGVVRLNGTPITKASGITDGARYIGIQSETSPV
jgi:hypothetical protein